MNVNQLLADLNLTLARIPLGLEQLQASLSAGLAEFHNGIRLQGARVVAVGPGGRGPLLQAGTGRLVGWSLRADGGALTVTLRDSRDDGGTPLAVLQLSDAAETVWLGPGGVSFGEGVWLDIAGEGTLAGAVYIGAVD